MIDMYEFKIAWCNVCKQGWIEIFKDTTTTQLFLSCSECETEWEKPIELTLLEKGTQGKHLQAETPTYEEIYSLGWEKYLIKK